MREFFLHYRFVLVVALLGVAAVLLTVKGRLPLAIRGLRKVLDSDARAREGDAPARPQSGPDLALPLWKRLLAFLCVILAFILAVIG